MKNEKRKVNEKQLKNKKRILRKLQEKIGFLMGISTIAIAVSCSAKLKDILVPLYLGNLFFWAMVMIICFISEKQLDKKLDTLKIFRIRDIAKEGSLRDLAIIKDKDIKNEIITSLIKNISLNGYDEKSGELMAEISLKDNPEEIYPIFFSREDISSKLDEWKKNEILENSIDSITIDKLDEETMKVYIKTRIQSLPIVTRKVKNEELIDILELKE